MLVTDSDIVDPILSIIVAALIPVSAGRPSVEVFRIIVEGLPTEVDMYGLCCSLESVEGVTLVHDIHAWMVNGLRRLRCSYPGGPGASPG